MGGSALERRASRHAGLAPLPLAAVAAKAHARNGVTGSDGARLQSLGMVAGDLRHRGRAMDRRHRRAGRAPGGGEFVRLDRSYVKFPPTDYNRIGTSYTRAVRHDGPRRDRARDRRVAHRQSLQRARMRQALVPEIVLGQAQGGFAMGVGYALLETLPLYEDGPGNGKWNLGQYLVARGSDLPLARSRDRGAAAGRRQTSRRRAWRKS